MMLRKPVYVAFRVACKSLMFPVLGAGLFIAVLSEPAAAHTRVSVGVSFGAPVYHDGWRHHSYGYYGSYRHHGRYGHRHHYGYHGGFRFRDPFYGLSVPIVVAPYPGVVYPAPVYPGPYYGQAGTVGPGAIAPSYCREFRTTININGKLQPAWGTACLQPDGTWRFVQ